LRTVAGRCEIYCKADAPVGIAYNRVKDIIDRGHKKDVLFLEFELLTGYPEQAMKMVYDYLEIPYYQHNFEYVEQYTVENDSEVHGIRGLHDIKNKVEPVKDYSLEILGDELYNKYSNAEIWR
jgi:sulfotransferase